MTLPSTTKKDIGKFLEMYYHCNPENGKVPGNSSHKAPFKMIGLSDIAKSLGLCAGEAPVRNINPSKDRSCLRRHDLFVFWVYRYYMSLDSFIYTYIYIYRIFEFIQIYKHVNDIERFLFT